MKIQFVQSLATNRECYMGGKVYTVADAEANKLIAHGVAVSAEPEHHDAKPEPKKIDAKPEPKKPEAK